MSEKLTQARVDRAMEKELPGTILYDAQVGGLRFVVGKKSCSWKVVSTINDGTSRPISVTLGRSDQLSAKEARANALALKLKLSNGEDPRRAKKVIPTVQDALDRYLSSRSDLSPRTVEFYVSMVAGPLKQLRKLPMDRIDREQVRSLHEKITRKSGPYMANASMRTLKALFNDVLRDVDLPQGNVVKKAIRFNKEKSRDWAVAPEDLPLLWRRLTSMDNSIRRHAWEVMLLTGLRSTDVKTMRWDQIDDDGVLAIPNPKGGKAFQLPLCRHLRQRLEQLRSETAAWESPWCFPAHSSSGHINELRRSKDWPYPPHGMRHTFRTVALEAGVSIDMTMILMNHRSGGAASVSWGYVTRANLLGPMRDAAETIAEKLMSYRS